MNLNGINYQQSVQSYDTTLAAKKNLNHEKPVEKAEKVQKETGVIYEPSNQEIPSASKKYTPNVDLVRQLQADAEARMANLQSLVMKVMQGQGNALGEADSIWNFLRTGQFTVDAETKAKAEADIAEDGYWGVTQTSDRILDFAKALTGGDPSKIEEMKEAFIKGFEMATKTWGDKLPELSQKTYDATIEKFDAWAEENKAGESEL